MIKNTSLQHYRVYKQVIHAIKHTDKYKQLKLDTKLYNDGTVESLFFLAKI